MSRQSSKGNPAPDIYVSLLFVSVAALMTGCIFLYLALNEFGFQLSP
jgi:hypothetical protein